GLSGLEIYRLKQYDQERDETFWGLLRPVAAKRRRLLYFILNRLAEDPYGVFELADSSRLWVPRKLKEEEI
ncbi:hypothetical protein HID58_021656, partial [Brassica napus]